MQNAKIFLIHKIKSKKNYIIVTFPKMRKILTRNFLSPIICFKSF